MAGAESLVENRAYTLKADNFNRVVLYTGKRKLIFNKEGVNFIYYSNGEDGKTIASLTVELNMVHQVSGDSVSLIGHATGVTSFLRNRGHSSEVNDYDRLKSRLERFPQIKVGKTAEEIVNQQRLKEQAYAVIGQGPQFAGAWGE